MELARGGDSASDRALIIVPSTLGDFSHGRTRKTLKKKKSSVFFRVLPWPKAGMMSDASDRDDRQVR
ncbi:MAG: hypothetical protein R6X17_09690, partial [Candidatus Competibacteraceae bacterium]